MFLANNNSIDINLLTTSNTNWFATKNFIKINADDP